MDNLMTPVGDNIFIGKKMPQASLSATPTPLPNDSTEATAHRNKFLAHALKCQENHKHSMGVLWRHLIYFGGAT